MSKFFKSIISSLAFIILLASCSKDDYVTGIKSTDLDKENPIQMEDKVAGRVNIAYVTWYGTSIPDPTYLTHICYAFAELYMVNNEYQKFAIEGNISRFEKIVALKDKNPNLKILLSFTNNIENGDNKVDGGFSALAKNADARKKFAEDCKAFCQKYRIDGIDVDWEFPGMTFGSLAFDDAVDVENHVLLMKDLREVLGNGYLLTYAGYSQDKMATTNGFKYIDVKAVDPYVDFVNIMTYDLAGAPQHQSALDKPSSYWDCKRSIDAYLKAGVAPSKLVLGIPFYGRKDFNSGGSINYKDIINFDESAGYVINNWDSEGNVPYVTLNGNFYCGYDNPKSIAIKGEWAIKQGMKGMMFWDYDGDDSKGTLRNSCWNAVMKKY